MAEELPVYTSEPRLTKEQKTGFVLLVIFAILAVGLGLLQVRNSLYAPFALNNKVPLSLKNDINSPDSLRYRDTDHDELSDFDELYVYATSPYLYDTFSYGMSDKDVVAKNLPLCPKGECADVVAALTVSSSISVPEIDALSESSLPLRPVTSGQDPGLPEDLNTIFSNPARLRQMLRESGVAEDVLKKLSDAQLLTMVNEILSTSSSTADGQGAR